MVAPILTTAGRLGGSYLLKKFFEFGKDKFTSQFGTSALDSILMLDDNTINQEFELYKNETKDDEKETLPAATQEGEFKDPEQEPPKDPNIAFNGMQINPAGSMAYPKSFHEKLDVEYEGESYEEWCDDWKYR